MNLYKILDVETASTTHQIKKAYYAKSKLHHPDVGGDPEVFKELVLAYSILSDEEKRKRYDGGETADAISKASHSIDFIIMNTVLQVFCQIVPMADLDHQDLIAIMRQHFSQAVVQTTHAMNAEGLKIKRFENALRRTKSSGENIFAASARSQIDQINFLIVKIQEQKAVAEGAIKFLESYSYEFDQAAVQIMMSQGSSYSFTVS
jgi:hypothetical protein